MEKSKEAKFRLTRHDLARSVAELKTIADVDRMTFKIKKNLRGVRQNQRWLDDTPCQNMNYREAQMKRIGGGHWYSY